MVKFSMKPVLLDNIFSEKELFFMYKEIINTPNWIVSGASRNGFYEMFRRAPMLGVKQDKETVLHYPLFLYGQSIVFRIANLLAEKKIGIPTTIERMWFNITNSGEKSQHGLHTDSESSQTKSIVLFLTPLWQPDWRGSFYVDGEEFKFKPGSAVIFDSNEYHQGEDVLSQTYNWQRLTCNILVRNYDV